MCRKSLIIACLLLVTVTVSAQVHLSADSLNQQLTIAQTKNQLAQEAYYQRQGNNSFNLWIPVFGPVLGAIVALLSAYLIQKKSRAAEDARHALLVTEEKEKRKDFLKEEKDKHDLTLKEEHVKNTRIAASDLIKKTTEGYHSITWVLWIARNAKEDCKIELIQEHDIAMKKLYPEIAGAQIALAAYSKQVYEETEPIVRKLYNYDGAVGRIALKLKDDNTKAGGITELGELWPEVYNFAKEIPKTFADSLSTAVGGVPAIPLTVKEETASIADELKDNSPAMN